MATSNELIRKFINGITKDDLCNSEVESECTERSEKTASEPVDDFYSLESTNKYLEFLSLKTKIKKYLEQFFNDNYTTFTHIIYIDFVTVNRHDRGKGKVVVRRTKINVLVLLQCNLIGFVLTQEYWIYSQRATSSMEVSYE